MLLLTNQFHDSFECLPVIAKKKKYFVPNQSFKASIYRAAFVIFLYERVRLPENSTACRTCLAGAGELLREQFSVFQWKWAPKVYSISFIRPSCITYQKKFLLHLPDKYAEQAILREQA